MQAVNTIEPPIAIVGISNDPIAKVMHDEGVVSACTTRKRVSRRKPGMRALGSSVKKAEEFYGNSFAWIGVRHRGHVWKQLDRAWFNQDWLSIFPAAIVQQLYKTSSNHALLLRKCNVVVDRGLSQFRFQHIRTRHYTFRTLLNNLGELPPCVWE
ncbi:hypothetical protein ACH5RR_008850 [Cinchona calisaya]|uniref:Uncharacterized protein n=1 Tax=Cinchona calisaya TaxID=153742 RepID=A0ABD3AD93_9GENT